MRLIPTDPKLDLLSEVGLFTGLTRRELRDAAALVDVVGVPAGTRLVEQGRYGRQFFVIADGRATVVRDGDAVATLGPGDVVGEQALLTGAPRSATVTATTDMRLLVGSPRVFASLLARYPDLDESVRATAATRQTANAA